MNTKNNPASAGVRKGKKIGFNVIDLLIVLLCIAVITVAVIVYFPDFSLSAFFSGSARREKAEITYVLEFQGINPGYASAVRDGDSIVTDLGYAIGSVSGSVEIEAYCTVYYDPSTGDVVKSEHPALVNILVTVTAEADSDPVTGYSADGIRIAAGAEYDVVMPGFEGHAVCISVAAEGGSF